MAGIQLEYGPPESLNDGSTNDDSSTAVGASSIDGDLGDDEMDDIDDGFSMDLDTESTGSVSNHRQRCHNNLQQGSDTVSETGSSTTGTSGKKGRKRKRKRDLYSKIRDQIAFYFSDSNLRHDNFMRRLTGIDINEPDQNQTHPLQSSSKPTFQQRNNQNNNNNKNNYNHQNKHANNNLKSGGTKPVPLASFLTFNKIAELTQNHQDLAISFRLHPEFSAYGVELVYNADSATIGRKRPFFASTPQANECTIYVERFDTTNGDIFRWLKSHFEHFGPVMSVRTPRHQGTKDLMGFAFIEFAEKRSLERVCQYFDEKENNTGGEGYAKAKTQQENKKQKEYNSNNNNNNNNTNTNKKGNVEPITDSNKVEKADNSKKRKLPRDDETETTHPTSVKRVKFAADNNDRESEVNCDNNNAQANDHLSKLPLNFTNHHTNPDILTSPPNDYSEPIENTSDQTKSASSSSTTSSTSAPPNSTSTTSASVDLSNTPVPSAVLQAIGNLRVLSKQRWNHYKNRYLRLQKNALILAAQLPCNNPHLCQSVLASFDLSKPKPNSVAAKMGTTASTSSSSKSHHHQQQQPNKQNHSNKTGANAQRRVVVNPLGTIVHIELLTSNAQNLDTTKLRKQFRRLFEQDHYDPDNPSPVVPAQSEIAFIDISDKLIHFNPDGSLRQKLYIRTHSLDAATKLVTAECQQLLRNVLGTTIHVENVAILGEEDSNRYWDKVNGVVDANGDYGGGGSGNRGGGGSRGRDGSRGRGKRTRY